MPYYPLSLLHDYHKRVCTNSNQHGVGCCPAGVDAGIGDDAGILPHVLALLQPLFFGMSTWRMEAHVARHPGQALPLTASQVLVVALSSSLWGMVGGGEFSTCVFLRERRLLLSIGRQVLSPGTIDAAKFSFENNNALTVFFVA